MLLLRLHRGRRTGLLLIRRGTLRDTVVRLAARVVLVDEREALHLGEEVLELRVLVATVAAANVVEPPDLAQEVVWGPCVNNPPTPRWKNGTLTGKADRDYNT